jgi:hypothetical protein
MACQFRTAAIAKSSWLAFPEIDSCVIEVVLGVLEDQGTIRVSQGTPNLTGNTGDEGVGRNNGLLWNDCSGRNDGALADSSVIQNGRTNADENSVFEDAPMHGGVVADGDHLADDYRIEMAHSVQNGAVLNIALRADADRIHIAPYDRIHPHAGMLAQDDISDNLRGGINIAACRDDW